MTDTGGVPLAANVVVRTPWGLYVGLAGDTPPVDVAPYIKSPLAWGGAVPEPTPVPNGGWVAEQVAVNDTGEPEQVLEAPEPPAPVVEEPDPAPAPEPEQDAEEDLLGTLPRPPKNGAGSGAPAWAAFAQQEGVEVSPDATRAEIIAAVESAGK